MRFVSEAELVDPAIIVFMMSAVTFIAIAIFYLSVTAILKKRKEKQDAKSTRFSR